MIVFINSEGTAMQVAPSPVYQNSALDGKLFVVAPFPTATGVTVSFSLPNGMVTNEYALVALNDNGINEQSLPDVVNSIGENYGIWQYATKNALITKYAGIVTAQFKFVAVANDTTTVLATSSVTFTVIKGVVALDTETPSADQWDTLIALFSEANAKLVYKTVVNVQTNTQDGEIIVTYSDGTSITLDYPISEEGTYSNNLVEIAFDTTAFAPLPSSEGVYFVQPKALINDDYIVLLERSATQDIPAENSQSQPISKNGYVTLSNEVFVGEDGTLYFEEATAFSGRILAISKTVVEGYQPAYDTIFDLTKESEIYINTLSSGLYRVKGLTKIYWGNGVYDYTVASVDSEKINLLSVIATANVDNSSPVWTWLLWDNFVHTGSNTAYPSVEVGTMTETTGYATQVVFDSTNDIYASALLTQTLVQQVLNNSTRPISSVAVNTAINNITSMLASREHFRGTFANTSDILALPNASAGDFAYNDQTLTKWVYDANTEDWLDSGISIPDTIVPKSNTVPLMDGTASVGVLTTYASGDHVHPHDTTKQDVLTFDSAPTEGSTNPITSGAVYNALQNTSAGIPIEKVGF